MHFALLTAVLWSFAGLASSRLARAYGSAPGNALRLICSTVVLLAITWSVGAMRLPPGAAWFALSGFLHLAVGDIALFAMYRRFGPRIGVLVVASLSPPVALLVEWWVLGTTVAALQLALAAAVLLSVVLAVAPRERKHLSPRELKIGLIAAAVSVLGQGAAGAVTRIAYVNVERAGESVGPWMPTLLRTVAALLGVVLWIALRAARGDNWRKPPPDLIVHRRVEGPPWIWLAVSTLLGPVLGVAVLMLAFETTPSVLVQSVLATLPVFMIPVAWFFDGNAPSKRSLFCGALAVAFTISLVSLGMIQAWLRGSGQG